MKELGDRAAQGRAYGNLGNTHYLLGSFTEATTFHKEVSGWQRRGGPDIGSERDGRGTPPAPSLRLGLVPGLPGLPLWAHGHQAGRAGQCGGGSTCRLRRIPGCSVTTWALCPCPQRLAIAKEFGDKAAERRAYSNLGNAHIFLGRFDVAAEYYK